jgi:hypothetical protein
MGIGNCLRFKTQLKSCISNEAFSAATLKTKLQEAMRGADPIDPSRRRLKSPFSDFKLPPSNPESSACQCLSIV